MLRTILTGKIHRATVTAADLSYEGSITIDQNLLTAAGFLVWEQVHVVNITNGARLVTYAISGTPGAGQIILNGAAARCAAPGDTVIILAYGQFTAAELVSHSPRLVLVDHHNQIKEVRRPQYLDEVALVE
ncbi:aspartate 1-decarboxylase [Candidatus Cyanaurora vandensis]|uniref:aspartate 1-decarboxylase n=1 Tax=Candidatus Cyanaurora vandensis TaxID=2714958 RepID=UPI00257CC0B2|nr:aspartate 1-decarboxylase [Candidatus Cyanaurora vandensis]